MTSKSAPAGADSVGIAKANGANLAVVGSYQIVTDQVRVNAHLIDTATGNSVGSFSATGPQKDLFKLEDALGEQLRRLLPLPANNPAIAQSSETSSAPQQYAPPVITYAQPDTVTNYYTTNTTTPYYYSGSFYPTYSGYDTYPFDFGFYGGIGVYGGPYYYNRGYGYHGYYGGYSRGFGGGLRPNPSFHNPVYHGGFGSGGGHFGGGFHGGGGGGRR